MLSGDCMDKEGVSNSGPLIHLAQIGRFKLLSMFSKIYIPRKVYEEVSIPDKPGEAELRSAENIEVLGVLESEVESIKARICVKLDEGELQALCLCEKLGVNLFLTDDLDARETGKKLGFEVHGSVGIIARAYRECLVDLRETENALKALYEVSSLFVAKEIIEMALKELRRFKKVKG